jgi:putative membrane protein
MRIKARDFFTTAEKTTIRQAVENAESTTSGEIAVVVVEASDPYLEGRLIGALSFSCLVALVLSVVLHYVTIWFFIPVTAILLFPFLYLFERLPHMKLAFVSKKRAEHAVKERAAYAFFQKGVYKTDNRTGILVFISLLERKVWIIGDEGIHKKTESTFWRDIVRQLTNGIQENKVFESLCEVIEKCGAELRRHFPEDGDKTNRLNDDICCE